MKIKKDTKVGEIATKELGLKRAIELFYEKSYYPMTPLLEKTMDEVIKDINEVNAGYIHRSHNNLILKKQIMARITIGHNGTT